MLLFDVFFYTFDWRKTPHKTKGHRMNKDTTQIAFAAPLYGIGHFMTMASNDSLIE